ncbi:MAG: hypothetical protein QG549_628 [Patescibacteria group bacterium]|nr:hypothetical protein [Patescibacteria group bacterium]
MNHESSSPRHAARPTSHRWKAGANAENLSVDSIIGRITRERQMEQARHSQEEVVGRHAVRQVASTESIPANHRRHAKVDEAPVHKPYSFEDSYHETLDALNSSIERATGKKYSPEDEVRNMAKLLDNALIANGLTPPTDTEAAPVTSPEVSEDIDPTTDSDKYGPVNENLGAVGDEQLEVIDAYKNEVLSSIDLFDKALSSVDAEPAEDLVIASSADSGESETKPRLKERISRLFKRRDSARQRVNLREAARNAATNSADSLRANVNNLKFNFSKLGRRISNRFNKRSYFKNGGEVISYSDNQSTLSFTLEGSNVLLGRDPKHPENEHKYAKDFTKNGSDMAMILTDKGRFGIGNGYIMDLQTGFYYDVFPSDAFDLTIGKNAKLPGAGNIGTVRAVELKYKTGNDANVHTKDTPSPFSDFYQFINDIDTEEAIKSVNAA